MELDIEMRTRDGSAYAKGIYSEKETIVKANGKISAKFHGTSSILDLRCNPELVDSEGHILKDISFNSSSTAAQFVNGNISNGLRVWKVAGKDLGKYLKEDK